MATIVKAKPGEENASLIRRFQKAVKQSRILTVIREKKYYKKPSEKKKEKRKEMERRKRSRG